MPHAVHVPNPTTETTRPTLTEILRLVTHGLIEQRPRFVGVIIGLDNRRFRTERFRRVPVPIEKTRPIRQPGERRFEIDMSKPFDEPEHIAADVAGITAPQLFLEFIRMDGWASPPL